MDNRFQFTQQILVPMFAQIADAMSHVASKRIVHGDLGCRNVLVSHVDTSDPRKSLVKITDFGLARWIDRPPTNEDKTIVPIRYCAPEILRNNHHGSFSEKSDIYSMGVLMWEALSNSEVPYAGVARSFKLWGGVKKILSEIVYFQKKQISGCLFSFFCIYNIDRTMLSHK
jgi:serine/threonine protein kinase